MTTSALPITAASPMKIRIGRYSRSRLSIPKPQARPSVSNAPLRPASPISRAQYSEVTAPHHAGLSEDSGGANRNFLCHGRAWELAVREHWQLRESCDSFLTRATFGENAGAPASPKGVGG